MPDEKKRGNSTMPYERDSDVLPRMNSKVDVKNHIAEKIQKWSFFDSNMNNNLVE